MNKQPGNSLPVVIAGAGPAGSGLAIRLALAGYGVVLVERERFPRHKLCGEFVSPECLVHFERLGVLDQMLGIGGDRITETVFYAPSGKSVSVPSEWFGNSAGALSISRAAMDETMLRRAQELGVRVLEETQVTGLVLDRGAVRGVRVRNASGTVSEIEAGLTIDATGRSHVLGKIAARESRAAAPVTAAASRLVGFKAHLKNAGLPPGRCEIYFFRGGYGGLSHVEGGVANHCFLVRAELAKEFSGRTDALVENVIFQNVRARATMQDAKPVFDWLAVAVDGFGVRAGSNVPGLIPVGDAAAFLDPFTGSGMLMALEGAELLAGAVVSAAADPAAAAKLYGEMFRARFSRRLRVCGLMRRAAFVPNLAGTVISGLSLSKGLREVLAKATRGSRRPEESRLQNR